MTSLFEQVLHSAGSDSLASGQRVDLTFSSGHSLEVSLLFSDLSKKYFHYAMSDDGMGALLYFEHATYRPLNFNGLRFDFEIAHYRADGSLICKQVCTPGGYEHIVSSEAYSFALVTPLNMLPEGNFKLR